MGCGGSSAKKDLDKNKLTETKKFTVLLFGMPDCGQQNFSKKLEKYFSGNSITQPKIEFRIVSSNRSDREKWIKEFTENDNVIASFFFMDVSSPSNVLLSVRTWNWFKNQFGTPNTFTYPTIVANCHTQNDKNNFTSLKEQLNSSDEPRQYDETAQNEFQHFVEVVQVGLKHAGSQDGNVTI